MNMNRVDERAVEARRPLRLRYQASAVPLVLTVCRISEVDQKLKVYEAEAA